MRTGSGGGVGGVEITGRLLLDSRPLPYLSWAIDFAARHDVPLYVDQFGAPGQVRGQLEFERYLIARFARHGLHGARWSYNAGQARRKVVGNDGVRALYAEVLGR